jgi:DNA-binding transcriptional LysR family regulator
LHQVRYALALARTLNFSRAAAECNVSQPSVSRAIKLLEDRLGGELFRREGQLSHLTELGKRLLPHLQQCHESAEAASQLARNFKSGKFATLTLGLARTVDIEVLLPFLASVRRRFDNLEFKFVRGDCAELIEDLKRGQLELAIGCMPHETWDRLESWSLFTETFSLVAHERHPLAQRQSIDLADLHQLPLVARPYCECAEQFAALLRNQNVTLATVHRAANEIDTINLLIAQIGVAVLPMSVGIRAELRRIRLRDVDLRRTVKVICVAGRRRTVPASGLLHELRSADWARRDEASAM